MNDKDFRIVIDNACQSAYDEMIKKTMILFDRGNKPKDIIKSGFKIENRVDFAKGYAICGLYMVANFSLNETFRMTGVSFTDYLIKHKDEQLEKLSMKVCDHFDQL